MCSLTVVADTGETGETSSIKVTINANNVDEEGSIALSPAGAPEVGTTMSAMLTDPDGGMTGESWQWQRSSDGTTWTDMPDATSADYTPSEDDSGMVLRATVTYGDALGTDVSLDGGPTQALPSAPEVTPTPEPTPTATPEPTPTATATPTPTVTVTPEEGGGFPVWLIVIIVIGVAVVVVGGILFFRNRTQQ
jgi:hypothetical protein